MLQTEHGGADVPVDEVLDAPLAVEGAECCAARAGEVPGGRHDLPQDGRQADAGGDGHDGAQQVAQARRGVRGLLGAGRQPVDCFTRGG
ncbi:hypothetical protein ACPC54_40120 [Kitasatospora sp. NPDC094028]